jgi:dTDP-4-dehydrorhamnose reductase
LKKITIFIFKINESKKNNENSELPHIKSMHSKTVLIVGIDSEIGSNLKKLLLQRGFIVEGTSRKQKLSLKGVTYLDLKNPNFKLINKKFDSVIICAAVTNILQCEKSPKESKKINVDNTIKLIDYVTENDSFVVFLSSNAVFDGAKSFYKHTDITSPKTLYGQYKKIVEDYIENNTNNACILRLTKVISKNTPFIKHWEQQLSKGIDIYAFNNKFLSAVSIESVISAIHILINSKKNGIFHLGGKEEISYFNFAQSYFSSTPRSLKFIKQGHDVNSGKSVKYNSLETYLPFQKK